MIPTDKEINEEKKEIHKEEIKKFSDFVSNLDNKIEGLLNSNSENSKTYNETREKLGLPNEILPSVIINEKKIEDLKAQKEEYKKILKGVEVRLEKSNQKE